MDTTTKMKKALNYTKNIVLSFVILFSGLVLVPVVALVVFLSIVDPVGWTALAMLAPMPTDSWSTQIVLPFFTISPSIAFIIWIVRDSSKFKSQGVNTDPFLWGVGMIFPLILIVFPLYFIRRNVTWLKEREKMISASENMAGLRGWYNTTNSITKNTKMKINKGLNVLKWMAVILVGLFGLGVLFRIPFYIQNKKTEEQVAKIHATKLTMDDVMGKYLPLDPGAEADKTVVGVDANNNGIRDDVELAIFREYPNLAKTRAVLLQYALALQMDAIQPFEQTDNITEVSREQSRAYDCVWQSLSNIKDYKTYIKETDKLYAFVGEKQRNTLERKTARAKFAEQIRSYSESDNKVCDIDFSKLPN